MQKKSKFSASRSPIEDYPELIDAKHVPLLRGTIWVMLVGSAIFVAMLLNLPGEYRPRIYPAAGLVVLAASAHVVLRRWGAVPTVQLLSIGSWILATGASLVSDGVRTPILIAYPIILIFSGWMLGGRSCARLFAASSVVVVVMAVGQHAGYIGGIPPATPAMVAVVHLIVLAISAVMTLYLLRLFRERYAEERRLNAEIKLNLQAVEKLASELRMLAEHIPALVFAGDRGGRCVFANHGFAEFFGIDPQELIGAPIGEIIDPNVAKDFPRYQEAALRGKLVEFVVRKMSVQGNWHSFDVTLVPKQAREGESVMGWYGLMHDVTKREEAAAELLERVTHDRLTGLENRLLLDDRLAHAVERSARLRARAAIMAIDLDRFKEVNDTLGHAAGDHLLCEVARRLKSSVRSADTVARIGGDEFVVLMEGVTSAESVQAIAAKILVELSRPVVFGTEIAQVGASIGIAIYPNAGRTSEELLRAADGAMYEAKAAGRNCYRMCANRAE